ncbi:MAG: threonylcarbamoyl-AMP synthase [Chloroflexi bacterium]|nr:threonylcarbamoyl-AMP synthase [Chloroflexota bacterium]
MKTKTLFTSDPNAISAALEFLRAGELIAFPTDTVYGVGTFAFNAEGATKIYAAKQRPPDKALPILLGEVSQIPLVAVDLPDSALKLAKAFWPGALTLIVPKHPDIPEEVSSLDTVGIRIPDYDFTRALLNAAGPMAVTSANISGQVSPVDADEVYAQLSGSLPIILDGGRTAGNLSSTVIDCTKEEIVILREGPISLKEIKAVLEN